MDSVLERLAANPIILASVAVAAYAYALALYSRGGRDDQVEEDGRLDDLSFVLVVPCLNERQVIGATIDGLLQLEGDYLILVVDDASDDGSVEALAPVLADQRVLVVRREAPDARVGKGAVLNTAVRAVLKMGLMGQRSADRSVLAVFDADGRVDRDFLKRVSRFFADPRVAGVQSAVRMTNRRVNLLAFWQHLEFLVWGEVFSKAKDRLGSATLGGNGQCVRLSALLELGPEPWRASLTEDLDLSLRLILGGWRIRFCPDAAVWQQAVPGLRRLLRQRARWAQGHVASWQYLPRLLRASQPAVVRIDLAVFLLMPALFLPIGISTLSAWYGLLAAGAGWSLADLLAWYALAFVTAPLVLGAWGRIGERRSIRAVVHAHAFVLYSLVWVTAFAIAVWYVIRGRRSWTKTSRAGERLSAMGGADG